MPLADSKLEKSINAALAANDLRALCRAIDRGILEFSSIIEFAHAARVDRVTLYRAFRLEKGSALDTMIRVLRVLGLQLAVEVRGEELNSSTRTRDNLGRPKNSSARVNARRFTVAFERGEMLLLLDVFTESLRAQENVSDFANKTIRSREALYRVFTGPGTPRFSTIMSFLNALGLRLVVRTLSLRGA